MNSIVLIGPVYPYKGGIAHYTGLLYRILEGKYHVDLISYKMQYPRFLYHGRQKDYESRLFRVDGACFTLHTANPFNIVRVGRQIRRQEPDLVIIQWWHPYFAPCYLLLAWIMGKKIRKILICHNVFPHERFLGDRFLTKLVFRQMQGFIVHSEKDKEDLLAVKPDAVCQRNPHPTYRIFQREYMSKEAARAKLGRGRVEKILLFFGFVREYKGLRYLLDAMQHICSRVSNVKLLIVGSFGEDKDSYLQMIRKNRIEDCVVLTDGYIPDEEVETYFAASDIVVLPYESATQSGIVQLAYGFEKPVIVTNVGGLPETVTDGKTGYVIEPFSAGQIAEAVVRFFETGKAGEMQENIRREAGRFTWERLREQIEAVAEAI